MLPLSSINTLIICLYHKTNVHKVSLTRMKFVSNCMGIRDYTFEAFYTKETQLSQDKHPKILILKLWDNVFRLKFSNPIVMNKKSILRSYGYQVVEITPGMRSKTARYDLSKENRIYLKEKMYGDFKRERLEALLKADNPITCDIRKKMKELHCKLID